MSMKIRLLIVAASIVSLPLASNAQKGSLQAGAHAGVNISKLCCGSMTINEDYKFGEGPAFGITAAYGFNNILSLAAELNYTTMGGKKNGMQALSGYGSNGTLYADFENKTVLNYLELPVMARVTFGKAFRYYANLGIFGSYLLSAKNETSGSSALYKDANGTQVYDGTKVSFDKNTDIKSQVKDFNFGIVGGLGAGYTFGQHGIWLDGRYVMGMPNIRENTAVNGKNSTGSIMATVGYTYTFNTGKKE